MITPSFSDVPMPDYFDTPDSTRLVAQFTSMGEPRAKARPRVTANGTYTPKGTREHEAALRQAWDAAEVADYPLTGTFRLDCHFYLGTRRRVDVDNLTKLVKDALNKRAYADDYLVFVERSEKFHTTPDRARTEVFLYLIDPDREEAA